MLPLLKWRPTHANDHAYLYLTSVFSSEYIHRTKTIKNTSITKFGEILFTFDSSNIIGISELLVMHVIEYLILVYPEKSTLEWLFTVCI